MLHPALSVLTTVVPRTGARRHREGEPRDRELATCPRLALGGEGLTGGAESRHERAAAGVVAATAEWTGEPGELRRAARAQCLDLPDFNGEIR
ncbi:hypothetical protein NDU88_000772 [Pleurodeles waltl]|uniref:Uncharacterized protein n=1 Tax=Pleurodeles waltl TaxID=8319 RepID=A0AAV7N901_PLEWA|nr:hypothetical protein NDU88_000772 [Pleurodeles waltl]